MTALIVLLTIVEVVVALLLVLLVLLQRSKDEGLGMAFGNAMGESLFGAQAGTVLTKATVILGVVFMVNTIALARLHSRSVRSGAGSIMDSVQDTGPMPTAADAFPLVTDESALMDVPLVQPDVPAPGAVSPDGETPIPALPLGAVDSMPEAAPPAVPTEAPAAAPQP